MTHNNQKLEDFRYDAKLFKQAYKAGLEAKKTDQKSRQRKYIKLGVILLSSILIVFSVIWILTHIPVKYSYVRAQQNSSQVDFVDVGVDRIPKDRSETTFDETLVNAQSAIYADLETGHIYYQKNIEVILPIASLTKLMTAILVVENFELNEVVEVNQNWYEQKDMEWSLELDKGDSITVESLLKAMLISSYNDAAYALADHYPGGFEEFVKEMNNHASTLGLDSAHFSNPAGLDDEGGNVMSVEDLYRLMTIIYRNETLMDILKKSYADLTWDIGSKRIFSTNALLNQYGNIAGKTGLTDDAGQCFMGITNQGRVSIVLNSLDRFADTKKLLQSL